MTMDARFLAVDLGASSGRVMDCGWNGNRFKLHELHRFPNAGVRVGTDIHWDSLRIWTEIQAGLLKSRDHDSTVPSGIAIDAWGVDYCLLDRRDRLIGNPYHYRDGRTNGVSQSLSPAVDDLELFRSSGVQTMQINTSFQLASMILNRDQQLHFAKTLLMIPDFFQFLLSGEKRAEYTEATTTQLYDLRTRCWSRDTLTKLQIPAHLFPPVVMPGTSVGNLRQSVLSDCGLTSGFPCIAVASHDTASAFAAIPDLAETSAFLSSGTWSLIGVKVDQPNLSDESFEGGFTNEGTADGGVVLLKNLTGLWILQECVRIWEVGGRRLKWTEVVEATSAAPPFRSFVDPSDSALQSPQDMCAAIGRYCKMSQQKAPESHGAIARCILESLSFTYRKALEDLERITGRTLTTIRIVGGGSLNAVFSQMTADACEREVIAGPDEAAALGNALVQAVATGHLRDIADGQEALKRSVQFRSYFPQNRSAWREAYEDYKSVVARGRRLDLMSTEY
jgi:rhamnulokinase